MEIVQDMDDVEDMDVDDYKENCFKKIINAVTKKNEKELRRMSTE
jgi:hypothetical protein